MYDQAHMDLSAVMTLQRITRGKVRTPLYVEFAEGLWNCICLSSCATYVTCSS